MADQIKSKQIFDPKLFVKQTKDALELEKALNLIEESLKKIAKDSGKALKGLAFEDSKDVKKGLKLIEKSAEAVKNLDAFEKKRLETLKKLKLANSGRADALAEVQVQLQEQNKVNKKLAKEKLGLIGAYEKESAKLIKLRKDYKNLAVQNKENTDEGKKLLKNITTLDKKLKDIDETVGQNQRSVGDYKKALGGLNSAIGKLGVVALITKGFQLLGSAFGNTRDGALALDIAFSKFTETAKVLVKSFIGAFGGIKDLFVAIGDSFALVGKKIERTFLEILNVTPFARDVTEDLKTINEEIKELEESSVSDAIDKITEAFDGNTDAIGNSIDAQEEYLKLQLLTKIAIEQQEKALAGLAEQRQILQDISDDDTIGFVTRVKAVKKAQEAAVEFAELEEKLALTKERLTIEAVKQDLRRSKVLTERQLAEITTGEQLQKILLDSNKARKVSDQNDEAFTAAFVERRNAEVEAQAFARDQEEKNRKTARDAFEQENDINVEFTEKRVASNEKIIASDSATLEQRQAALKENQKLEQELFEESIRLIVEQGKASIDLRKDLTEAEKEQQKALLSTEAIQDIINEQDAKEIFNLIRRLDLGEIEEKVLKDTLKIKEDIAASNKESIKVESEAGLKTKELQEEIALQERVLAGESVNLEDERTSNQKKNLQDRINLLEEDSIERLQLQKELNDLLIDDEKKAAKEKEDLRQKEKDEAIELANQIADATIEALDKISEARLERLDAEIARREDSIARMGEKSKGEITEGIAFEEAELEKARLKQQQEAEKAAKKQRLILVAQTFLNQLANSEEEGASAIAKALATAIGGEVIAETIVGSAFEGTEDTGAAGDGDSKGGKLWMLHPHERVMDRENNSKVGSMTNDDLASLAYDYQNGSLENRWAFMPRAAGLSSEEKGATIIRESNDEVIQAIKDNRVNINYEWNSLNEAIETQITGVRKTITKHKFEPLKKIK